ncbi:putative toxin-antitoxin system toxin component, PIN family [Dolichospermum circinale CS-1225]|uniref:Toxin-antitoxin system toxin component, PIN family n=1 Tax=Dolichospermum circinale CS-537/01 TaxID=3021739 RepID=A0ABT5A4F1_9CYAN|nr:putative toxin-antitoxin system toxin component, PIN family [Dolichospermum circinale]MDB9465140.1 putative toxin-antitoxin system toxin component, PIN family [Dolichospermum circinale CS-539/09]MDB9469565.1 putative toxin-antitoxin system toxin component, PIN family [Dolichospermum circinale CS-539]MDB9486779.1 putative toxin-antitoxin system toxin component, PIN family [Dolichospermum circinale CS-537/01]MDB9520373.1 putative toxin-antitoxin system toxin component, PIN family [Dolichosperm
MNNLPKYVLDTNIIVSAFLFKKSQPRQALDKARHEGNILMSEAIWQEIIDVLSRPKFEKYVTLIEREFFLDWLAESLNFIEIRDTIVACRDAKDDKLLELAVNGNAELIVSGDEDLLILNPFQEIAIVTVRQFLEME